MDLPPPPPIVRPAILIPVSECLPMPSIEPDLLDLAREAVAWFLRGSAPAKVIRRTTIYRPAP